MKRKASERLCSKCPEPGYKFHAARWLCIVHYRIVTMRNAAQAGGKVCRKKLNREMWAKFGKQWQANSKRRKEDAANRVH